MTRLWLWPLAGGCVGILNGLMRWMTVRRLSPDATARSMVLVLGGLFVRLGLVGGLLAAGLRGGAAPGLLAFAGLWIARWAVVVWLQEGQGLREEHPTTALREREGRGGQQ